MKRVLFRGAATALITPMTKDGLDLPALDSLVEAQIDSGIAALVACGTTGEPSTLSDVEWETVLARVIRKSNGRVPVIAGTGGNNTQAVLAHAKLARSLGADAQLCVSPYYNKTTQAGLAAHYEKIADESLLPVILYNVPSRTGLSIDVSTVVRLARHENILALKEASGDIARAADIRNACGDSLALYSGADELTVPMLSLGGLGVISVLSNVWPRRMAELCSAWFSGDIKSAADIQLHLMPLIRALFSEVNPIPIKAAMAMAGQCENELRLPLVKMSAEKARLLRAELQKEGLCR